MNTTRQEKCSYYSISHTHTHLHTYTHTHTHTHTSHHITSHALVKTLDSTLYRRRDLLYSLLHLYIYIRIIPLLLCAAHFIVPIFCAFTFKTTYSD